MTTGGIKLGSDRDRADEYEGEEQQTDPNERADRAQNDAGDGQLLGLLFCEGDDPDHDAHQTHHDACVEDVFPEPGREEQDHEDDARDPRRQRGGRGFGVVGVSLGVVVLVGVHGSPLCLASGVPVRPYRNSGQSP